MCIVKIHASEIKLRSTFRIVQRHCIGFVRATKDWQIEQTFVVLNSRGRCSCLHDSATSERLTDVVPFLTASSASTVFLVVLTLLFVDNNFCFALHTIGMSSSIITAFEERLKNLQSIYKRKSERTWIPSLLQQCHLLKISFR